MLSLEIPLVVVFVLCVDRNRRIRSTLVICAERIALRAYAMHVRRRRARALKWINRWRAEHGRTRLREPRKGVRGSRTHGVIALNMAVYSYADGVWSERNGAGGGVPAFVAQFARDFDDGFFGDLVERPLHAPAAPVSRFPHAPAPRARIVDRPEIASNLRSAGAAP
jgi:hypothetical protein